MAFLSLHTSPMEQPGSGDAGGMNVYIRSLASALAETGVEVDIFTRATGAGRPAVEHPCPGVCVHNVAAGPRRKVPKEDLPELLHSMVAEIERSRGQQWHGRYDLIHSHYWISGVAGLALSRQWNVPFVHTMHTMAKVKNLVLQPGEKPEPRSREDGEYRIVDGATRLIANTGVEAAELVSHYSADFDCIDVAAPGVDLSTFTAAFRDRSRAARAISPGSFLFAGRIQWLKGPQVLVQAAALLRRRRPDIDLKLTIFGAASGSGDFNLASLVNTAGMDDVVTHLPPVAAPELAGWYRSADVVAMPSYSESFGLVALEAQACGCGTPVLAARVGGLSRAVSEGPTGVLVDGHMAAGWADALEGMYDDPVRRQDMGRAAAVHTENAGWRALPPLRSRATAPPHNNTAPGRNSCPSEAAPANASTAYGNPLSPATVKQVAPPPTKQ